MLNLKIVPGESLTINTFHGHQSQVVASFDEEKEVVLVERMTTNAQNDGTEQTFRFGSE